MLRSSKARRCSGVGVVVMVKARRVVGGLDLVGADGGQIGQQGGEAVYRGVVVGAFTAALFRASSERWAGATGLARLAAAAGLSLSWNRIGASDLFHVPADVVGQHA